MKKASLLIAIAAMPLGAIAQSAVDAYNLSQTDVRGTARFMAMGGAFTALGGDLSTLNQNPAGIGIYRRSEIGATLDISPRNFVSQSPDTKISTSKTNVYCNNFGYIGTARLDGALRSFSWGASYNRIASFDRTYDVYNSSTNTSLSNYIAAFTGSTPASSLNFSEGYNPYIDSDNDWLSILAYNSLMISPTLNGNGYSGLYTNGTQGDAYSQIRERGYVDEYAIDFGGNVNDVVYWGVGFGITDLNYNLTSVYSESMADAVVPYLDNGTERYGTGDAGFELINYRAISGTGWNFKAGLILKPIQQFRIGVAIHTPTWYSMSQSAYAETNYSYYYPGIAESQTNPYKGNEYTDDSYYHFRLNSPWKFMVGAAAVIGNSAIVSLDYEYQAYGDMKVKYQDSWGNYVNDDYVNDDIKNYFKSANIIRLGLEYRLSSSLSLRAGYNHATTNVKDDAATGAVEVYTSGMNPSYVLNKTTDAISVGLGYRYQAFYVDAAYVYRKKTSTYHAFTNFNGIKAPSADLSETTNNIVLSVGFKF
ncbi:MAG: hypothetical protein NC405_00455 [Odoribacter sp.]|nr:hypothetical protein [Odoribacter sp.]